jgi:O-antigen/teichoic acid export membrane protein
VLANVIGTQRLSRRAARAIPPPAPERPAVAPVVRFAAIASINIFISLVVYQRTEVFFLAHYSTDTEIALYSIPFAAVAALILVPRAIGLTLAPAIATLWGGGEVERIRSGLSRSLRIVVLLNTVVTALAAALMPAAIKLAYGSAFSRSGPVALIMLATVPFVPLSALSMSLLVGIGRQWAITIVGIAATVVDLILDWTLIPRYGAIGAAIANTGAQLTGSIPLAFYALGTIGGITLHGRTLLRGIGAAAVAGLCAALAAHAFSPAPGLVLGLVVFAVTFTLASLVLRPLGSDDARWIDETLGGWAYGLVRLATRSMSVRAPSPP